MIVVNFLDSFQTTMSSRKIQAMENYKEILKEIVKTVSPREIIRILRVVAHGFGIERTVEVVIKRELMLIKEPEVLLEDLVFEDLIDLLKENLSKEQIALLKDEDYDLNLEVKALRFKITGGN